MRLVLAGITCFFSGILAPRFRRSANQLSVLRVPDVGTWRAMSSLGPSLRCALDSPSDCRISVDPFGLVRIVGRPATVSAATRPEGLGSTNCLDGLTDLIESGALCAVCGE